MSEETIWYRNGEQKVGPFSISTIKELREKNAISDDTLVSDDDGTNWTDYSNFAEKSKDTEPYEIEEKGKNVSEFEIPPINLPLEPTPTKNGKQSIGGNSTFGTTTTTTRVAFRK